MINILSFLNELRLHTGAIWVEDESIHFSAPKKFQNQETSDFIRENKSRILSLLRENNIDSADRFLKTQIWKDKDRASYPLSFAQERLWFIEQYEQGTNAYHIPVLYKLKETAVKGLVYALEQIIQRHEILRTTLKQTDQQQVVQVVHDQALSVKQAYPATEEEFMSMLKLDMNRPFDLSTSGPVRVKFYHLPTEENEPVIFLLVNIHHIASDGWSMQIFEKELQHYFQAYERNDLSFSLPPLEIQYKEYAVWQRSYLKGAPLLQQLSYWKEKLRGYQSLELPIDYLRPVKIDYQGLTEDFSLEKELSNDLRILAKDYGVSLYSLLLSSLAILFSKYTGQTDIVIGSPIANRHHHQTQDLIGFFVNMQANRIVLSDDEHWPELMQRVYKDQVNAQQHQDLPFEQLVVELDVERDPSRHPIFQVLFGMQSFHMEDQPDVQKLFQSVLLPGMYKVEKFDLSVLMDDSKECISGQFSYATVLFQKETIIRMKRHYVHLLEHLTQQKNRYYSELSLLNSEETEYILTLGSHGRMMDTGCSTIHSLFESQAARMPQEIAVISGDQQLTYRELNEKSNRIARKIRMEYQRSGRIITADTRIALFLDRGLEMIIGILSVLKAGAAYVPVDPGYPAERVQYILKDANVGMVLSKETLCAQLHSPIYENMIVTIGADDLKNSNGEEAFSDLMLPVSPEDVAYVIYTSGTTGQPKGVMVEHRQVVSFAMNNNYINQTEVRRVAGISNYAFDGSIFDIFFTLLNGKCLVIMAQEDILDHLNLDAAFLKCKVDTAFMTTGLFNSLVQVQSPCLRNLQQLLFGGEACNLEIINKFKAHYPGTSLIHVYGPTENIVFSSFCNLNNYDTHYKGPIGIPLADKKLYVLDSKQSLVPVGVTGELYIGGHGIARGYLNHPELTAKRFVNNPFAAPADKKIGCDRLYKTGDLVRWLPDGNIEYLGRNDDQVKIRGFRIELGEIEHALSQMEGVVQSCVIVKERKTTGGTGKYLAGYYVPGLNAADQLPTDLLERLSLKLPAYMLPDVLVPVNLFPLTSNGKVDKRALPEPELHLHSAPEIPPVTALEIKIGNIYSEVLGLPYDRIGVHQNFFSIGGNSILCIQLRYKLNQLEEFRQLTIADLFRLNTIDKLVQSVQPSKQTTYKLQNRKSGSGDHEIAIIAMSGAFSGAKDIPALWQLISNQQEGIRFYSQEECRIMGVDESLLEDPLFIPVSGQVEGIELFDPLFWKVSPYEARLMDPQIRKFIEHSWWALEMSGYAPRREEYLIGVFAGSGNSEYFNEHILRCEQAEQINRWEASVSNSKDALATKTAYLLGLQGPANSINTACSTGLVAIVEACKNLQLGTCDMALAGGVSLFLPDQIGYIHQEGMIFSKDGHCRTFDKDASGTIGGSGVGVVMLKRLQDAVKDEDTILGVIKGYATNNDGDRKTSYTAPSVTGQSECIINAQQMAGIGSDQIDYVECHGTATHLGDPIEVQALKEAFQYKYSKEKSSVSATVLGAVKANIGHTNSAAGVAGVIKVCTMLQNQLIPGQMNYSGVNPELRLEHTPFEIIRENRHWQSFAGKQRLAGVSSFGVGGTNAHVVIGEYTQETRKQKEGDAKEQGPWIIPFSAKSRSSLEQYKQALLEYAAAHTTVKVAAVAYTLQEKRTPFNYRSAISAGSMTELMHKLERETAHVEVPEEKGNRLVFMFPGHGVQYANMTKELYDQEEAFRKIVDHCIALANPCLDTDLHTILFPKTMDDHYHINEIQWSSIGLFIIEYALATYLDLLGVKADAYIGHSLGEYVAATLAGIFELEDAIRLVIRRGRLMQSMQKGAMLAVNGEEQQIKNLVAEYDCEIAAINSAEDWVVAGTPDQINALQKVLDEQSISATRINSFVAGHSRLMEQAANEFVSAFKGIQLHEALKPMACNLYGTIAKEELTETNYWCRQLRNTVQFARGIETLSAYFNHRVNFVEVGTGKGLSFFVNKYKKKTMRKSVQAVPLLPSASEKQEKKSASMNPDHAKADLIGKLWMHAVITHPNEKEKDAKQYVTDLPGYRFDWQRCWIDKSNNALSLLNKRTLLHNWENVMETLPETLTKQEIRQLLEKLLTAEKTTVPSQQMKNSQVQLIEGDATPMEHEVAQLVGEVLGITQLSRNDDFFMIGGNSLLAVKLLSLLRKKSIDLSLQDIIAINSVHKISTHIQHKQIYSIVVPLKINNNGNKNVFFIHAIGGTVIGYKAFADLLDNTYNYYGIQNINIYGGKGLEVQSLEELASVYLEEIIKVQPDGEYIIGGSSLGGNLAYEISAQLQKSKRASCTVFMFDSWAFFSDEFRKKESFVKELQRQQTEYQDMLNETQVDDKDNLMDAQWKLMQLLLSYQPSPLNASLIYLFKADQQNAIHATNKPSEHNGWMDYTKELMIYKVPGDHTSIMQGEGLHRICEILSGKLKAGTSIKDPIMEKL